jgi:hypothetical protein
MIRFLTLIPMVLAAAPLPAEAYSCGLSPAKDAVIIKTDNASDHAMTCRVECTFASPDGPVTIACVRAVPPETKDWYICLRATGGKAMEFSDGTEICK